MRHESIHKTTPELGTTTRRIKTYRLLPRNRRQRRRRRRCDTCVKVFQSKKGRRSEEKCLKLKIRYGRKFAEYVGGVEVAKVEFLGFAWNVSSKIFFLKGEGNKTLKSSIFENINTTLLTGLYRTETFY